MSEPDKPEYSVLILGQTQAGKSSLIEHIRSYADPGYAIDESLLGNGIVSKTDSTTSILINSNFPTYEAYRKDTGEIFDLKNLATQYQDEEDYRDVLLSHSDDVAMRPILQDPNAPSESMQFRFLDTPGLNGTQGRDSEHAANIVKEIVSTRSFNLIVFVISSQDVLTEEKQLALEYFAFVLRGLHSKIVFLHTHVDYSDTHSTNKTHHLDMEMRNEALSTIFRRHDGLPVFVTDNISKYRSLNIDLITRNRPIVQCLVRNTIREILTMATAPPAVLDIGALNIQRIRAVIYPNEFGHKQRRTFESELRTVYNSRRHRVNGKYSVLIIGRTQVGKSILVEHIKNYANPSYSIDRSLLGNGNLSKTESTRPFYIESNLPAYEVFRKATGEVLALDNLAARYEDEEDYREILFSREKDVGLRQVPNDPNEPSEPVEFRFLDTPGLNDTSDSDRSHAVNIISEMINTRSFNLIVIVVSYKYPVVTQEEQLALEYYANVFRGLHTRIMFLHTHVDYAEIHHTNADHHFNMKMKNKTLSKIFRRYDNDTAFDEENVKEYENLTIDLVSKKRPVINCLIRNTIREILKMATQPAVVLDTSGQNIDRIRAITHPSKFNDEERKRIKQRFAAEAAKFEKPAEEEEVNVGGTDLEQINILLIGDVQSGKTSLVETFRLYADPANTDKTEHITQYNSGFTDEKLVKSFDDPEHNIRRESIDNRCDSKTGKSGQLVMESGLPSYEVYLDNDKTMTPINLNTFGDSYDDMDDYYDALQNRKTIMRRVPQDPKTLPPRRVEITFLDTPKIEDIDGQDEKHTKAIIERIIELGSVNLIVVVVNSNDRPSKAQRLAFHYYSKVIHMLQGHLSNVVFLYTHVSYEHCHHSNKSHHATMEKTHELFSSLFRGFENIRKEGSCGSTQLKPFRKFTIDFRTHYRNIPRCMMTNTLKDIVKLAMESPHVRLDNRDENLKRVWAIKHPDKDNNAVREKPQSRLPAETAVQQQTDAVVPSGEDVAEFHDFDEAENMEEYFKDSVCPDCGKKGGDCDQCDETSSQYVPIVNQRAHRSQKHLVLVLGKSQAGKTSLIQHMKSYSTLDYSFDQSLLGDGTFSKTDGVRSFSVKSNLPSYELVNKQTEKVINLKDLEADCKDDEEYEDLLVAHDTKFTLRLAPEDSNNPTTDWLEFEFLDTPGLCNHEDKDSTQAMDVIDGMIAARSFNLVLIVVNAHDPITAELLLAFQYYSDVLHGLSVDSGQSNLLSNIAFVFTHVNSAHSVTGNAEQHSDLQKKACSLSRIFRRSTMDESEPCQSFTINLSQTKQPVVQFIIRNTLKDILQLAATNHSVLTRVGCTIVAHIKSIIHPFNFDDKQRKEALDRIYGNSGARPKVDSQQKGLQTRNATGDTNILLIGDVQSGKTSLIDTMKLYAEPGSIGNEEIVVAGMNGFPGEIIRVTTFLANLHTIEIRKQRSTRGLSTLWGTFGGSDVINLEQNAQNLTEEAYVDLLLNQGSVTTRTICPKPEEYSFGILEAAGFQDGEDLKGKILAILETITKAKKHIHCVLVTLAPNSITSSTRSAISLLVNMLPNISSHLSFIHTGIDYRQLHICNQQFHLSLADKKRQLQGLIHATPPIYMIDHGEHHGKPIHHATSQNMVYTILHTTVVDRPDCSVLILGKPKHSVLVLGRTQSGKSSLIQHIKRYANPAHNIDQSFLGNGVFSKTSSTIQFYIDSDLPTYEVIHKVSGMALNLHTLGEECDNVEVYDHLLKNREYTLRAVPLDHRSPQYQTVEFKFLDTPGINDTDQRDTTFSREIIEEICRTQSYNLILVLVSGEDTLSLEHGFALEYYANVLEGLHQNIAFLYTHIDFKLCGSFNIAHKHTMAARHNAFSGIFHRRRHLPVQPKAAGSDTTLDGNTGYKSFTIDMQQRDRPIIQCLIRNTIRDILQLAVSNTPVVLDTSADNISRIHAIDHPDRANRAYRERFKEALKANASSEQPATGASSSCSS